MAISQPAARCIANCIRFLHSHPISQPTIALTITLTLSLNQLPLLIRPISTLSLSLYLFSLSLPNAMGNAHPPLSLPTPHNKFILNYFSNFPDATLSQDSQLPITNLNLPCSSLHALFKLESCILTVRSAI